MAKSNPPELDEVAERVGDFMRYWGFSKVDGRIWTLLYLSPEPLSAAMLGKKLKVSKALLSKALNELLRYEVIRVARTARHGTALYEAAPNIGHAIENVLRMREQKMLADIHASARLLDKMSSRYPECVVAGRAHALSEMCESASLLLQHIVLDGKILSSIAHLNSKDS